MESIAILIAAGTGLLLACVVPHLALRESRNMRLVRQRVSSARPGRNRRFDI
jgi:hypothetical protein